MIKPTPLSGFPEWLPAQRLAELHFIDVIREVYELYGYTSIETAAVERVKTLEAKGEVDKEIYAIGRLRGEPGRWEMALHFDLTVPLARYVAMNYGSLNFPFKRYQIQKVWRGERPQEGRFREFYQADIDVIAEETLPLHFDAEMPAMIHEVFQRLGIKAQIQINNRKILRGYYASLGLEGETMAGALRETDKLDKIGHDKVKEALINIGLTDEAAEKCLALSAIKGTGSDVLAQARELGCANDIFAEGLKELEFIADELKSLPNGSIAFNLGIVRGLDYYTGSIYETILPDYPSLGSICSGGRYENLASEFINRKLPGVGISIGLSRLISHLFASGAIDLSRQTPTAVLVCWPEPELRASALACAKMLRGHGIPAEVYHEPQSLKKQVRYADRKGIPYVLFPHKWTQEEGIAEIKELATGAQEELPLNEWCLKYKGQAQ
ncbi:MAG: histidine--tRNA ligase [bacterium]|nr:histidine--tRNA ligase [bacterium]